MAQIETIKVTDGSEAKPITINACDLADWQAKGYKPVQAIPEQPKPAKAPRGK